MEASAGFFDQVVTDLDELLRSNAPAVWSDAERIETLRGAGEVLRRVEALVVETIACADPDLGQRFGCRSTNELVQRAVRTDAAGASRIVKATRLMRRETALTTGAPLPGAWPQLRRALLDGVIGVAGLLAATAPVEQAGLRVGGEDRSRADAELAALARGFASSAEQAEAEAGPAPTVEDLRVFSQVIVAYLDPDGAEPEHDRATRSRGVRLGRVADGLVPIRGALLPEVAGQLQRIWDAYLNPKVDGPPAPPVSGVRFAPSEADPEYLTSAEDAAGRMPGSAADTRSRGQLQHDALAAVLGIAARHDDMPRLGGAAPTLVVSVTAQDYATGRRWAHIDGLDTATGGAGAAGAAGGAGGAGASGATAPVSLARHTACGGTIQRVLFDPEGRIIGLGTTERIFTVHQRRAILLRDRECLIPGCHVPGSWCEIHHVTEHARGGPTHTDNGVALCWHHHRTLDTSGWEIRIDGGTPMVRGPAWWDPTRRWWNPHPRPALARSTLTG
ncbi:DUF222 domain-containing protein [Microbacterium sp. 179-I 3D2 NHS]|uniref:HNH endonuclease signature motif containing protein n=1 Tax=Microbacterium sp. 179-I 3D2 NHS TaxID=3235178 RepID=UPI0039A08292